MGKRFVMEILRIYEKKTHYRLHLILVFNFNCICFGCQLLIWLYMQLSLQVQYALMIAFIICCPVLSGPRALSVFTLTQPLMKVGARARTHIVSSVSSYGMNV